MSAGRIGALTLCLWTLGCGGPGAPDGGADRDGALRIDSGRADGAAGDAGLDASALDASLFDAAAIAPTVSDSDYAADDDADLLNPERGIYYWSPHASEPHTLVAEWLYLGEHCDEDLVWAGHGDSATSPVLEAYADDLAAHRAAGRKVLFRPRYDTAGAGGVLNRCGVFQADSAERMRGHVDAVASMLADFIDVIAFIEAGYLGRWGEWNHADHAPTTAPILVDPVARRAFITYVLDAYAAAGVDRFVGLRRPLFARELADAEPSARVGLYNDCFMTTSSDYGTYSNFESGNPSNFASALEAKEWAIAWSAGAPFGGETCPTGDGTERWRMCSAMVGDESEPGSLHMSYLHGGYALDARSTWMDGGCYDEIRRRLGYRFEVTSVRYPPAAAAGQPVAITITVRNTGWSRLHNPRRAYVVLRSADEAYLVGAELEGYVRIDAEALEGDEVSAWDPGAEATLTATFLAPAAGIYDLRITLPDPHRPDIAAYAVAFASTRGGSPLFDPATKENELGVSMTVTP